ncbi:MAG: hypothetical protein VB138_01840 [Burkholderia sp.]
MDKDYDRNSDKYFELAKAKLEEHNRKLEQKNRTEKKIIENKVRIAWYATCAFVSILTVPIVIYSAKILEIIFRLK